VKGQRHAPAALYPRETPDTHCTGGWVGPRAGLDKKISSPPGFDPRTVQPVASRYTDYATGHIYLLLWVLIRCRYHRLGSVFAFQSRTANLPWILKTKALQYQGADKSLARQGRKQAAPVQSVMGRGMD